MEKLPHIVLPDQPETRPYTSTSSAVIQKIVVPRNRAQHGQYLQNQFKKAWEESQGNQLALVGVNTGQKPRIIAAYLNKFVFSS